MHHVAVENYLFAVTMFMWILHKILLVCQWDSLLHLARLHHSKCAQSKYFVHVCIAVDCSQPKTKANWNALLSNKAKTKGDDEQFQFSCKTFAKMFVFHFFFVFFFQTVNRMRAGWLSVANETFLHKVQLMFDFSPLIWKTRHKFKISHGRPGGKNCWLVDN